MTALDLLTSIVPSGSVASAISLDHGNYIAIGYQGTFTTPVSTPPVNSDFIVEYYKVNECSDATRVRYLTINNLGLTSVNVENVFFSPCGTYALIVTSASAFVTLYLVTLLGELVGSVLLPDGVYSNGALAVQAAFSKDEKVLTVAYTKMLVPPYDNQFRSQVIAYSVPQLNIFQSFEDFYGYVDQVFPFNLECDKALVGVIFNVASNVAPPTFSAVGISTLTVPSGEECTVEGDVEAVGGFQFSGMESLGVGGVYSCGDRAILAISAQPEGMTGSVLPIYLATVDTKGHVDVKGRVTAPGPVMGVQPVSGGKGFVIFSENYSGNSLTLAVYKLLRRDDLPYLRAIATTLVPGNPLGADYAPLYVKGKYVVVASTAVVQLYRILN